jgi:DNA-binding NtrC family response regulator
LKSETASIHQDRTVLVVDDNVDFLNEVRLMLLSNDIKDIIALDSGSRVIEEVEKGGIAVILMDWMMPETSGADLLPLLIQRFPHIPVIVMTAVSDVQTVVGCIKMGAFDYITKPVDVNRLLSSISKAFQLNELAIQNRRLKEYLMGDTLLRPDYFSSIITANPRMQALFKIIETMAGNTNPVLVTGETGVGKELFARAIHATSGLSGPFVPLNAAGLDDMMFADTLFGHKKGAFTGAHEQREGLIAKAQGGTLFLDEIGDIGVESQMKLLRLLQEREYYRLGSDALIKSNARIIAASNCDFEAMMASGKFRRDLYHRLRNHHIHIPPLRERRGDIPLLIESFLQKAAESCGRPVPSINSHTMDMLVSYDYPGNVRELQHFVEQAVSCNHSATLDISDFIGLQIGDDAPKRSLQILREGGFQLKASFDEFPDMGKVEQLIIEEALRITAGNKTQAADLLGISRPTLNRKLETPPLP